MNNNFLKIGMLSCLIVLTGFQCDREIEFEDNSIISFEGTIVNQSGLPVPNIKVEIYASSFEALKISSDYTDSEGKFKANCSATNETYFIIVINEAGRLYDRKPLNTSFAPKYVYAKELMFQDHIFTLDNLHLESPVNLRIITSFAQSGSVYYQLISNRDVNSQFVNTEQTLYNYSNSNETNDYQFPQNSNVYIEYVRNGALQNLYGRDTIELYNDDVIFEIPK